MELPQPPKIEMDQNINYILDFVKYQVSDLYLQYERAFPGNQEEFKRIFFHSARIFSMLVNNIKALRHKIAYEVLIRNRFHSASIEVLEYLIKLNYLLNKTRAGRHVGNLTTLAEQLVEKNFKSLQENYTMLHICVLMKNPYITVMESMLSGGHRIDPRDNSGRTPLHVALDQKCSSDVINFLLKRGAHVKIPDYRGRLPTLQIDIRVDLFYHINLQNLTARSICDSNIPYDNVFPKALQLYINTYITD